MLQTDDGAAAVLGAYFTEEQLAAELAISTRTLIRWRRLREAPPVTRIGRRLYYRRDAVAKWLADRQREAA